MVGCGSGLRDRPPLWRVTPPLPRVQDMLSNTLCKLIFIELIIITLFVDVLLVCFTDSVNVCMYCLCWVFTPKKKKYYILMNKY